MLPAAVDASLVNQGEHIIPDANFLKEIAAEVEFNNSLRAPATGTAAPLGTMEVDRQLTATDALVAGVLDGSALVGEMPPQPPTLRAAAGRLLVSIVRRAVFWLSDQIRSFQVAVAASQQEQARLLRAQAAEIVHLRQTIDALEARMSSLAENLKASQNDARMRTDAMRSQQEVVFAQFERRIKELLPRVQNLEALRAKHDELRAQQEHLSRQADRYLHQTRMQLALQERRLTTLFRETRRSGPPASGEVGSAAQADGAVPMTDPIYVEFENLFRGDRADIKRRFEVYIPRLKDAKLGQPDMPVLDLGCGRGEWLELLRDEGLTGSGVDMNLVMIEECRGLGLSVTAGDAIHHLRSLPAASIGVVTGFHIVEHLVLDDLLLLLDETNRVLRPGGMAIFETPNPSNIKVSTENFYLDPTHRNPLPKALLKFLVEARGLCDIEVLPLHPYPASYRLEDDGRPATKLLNQLLFSEQDYAVIGRKA